jgi:hypothetical protein
MIVLYVIDHALLIRVNVSDPKFISIVAFTAPSISAALVTVIGLALAVPPRSFTTNVVPLIDAGSVMVNGALVITPII